MTQTTINFERSELLGILRDAQLPSVVADDGHTVSAVVLKGVLRVLDDHGRGRTCFVKHATIAVEACISVRHSKRAVWCLAERLGVLVVERRSADSGRLTCNHYTIVWSELSLLCPSRVHRRRGDQSALGADQSALGADQSALGADQSALTALHRSAFEAQQEAPPPLSPSQFVDRSSGLDGWEAVEEGILQLGISDWNTPIVAARRRVTPGHVLRVLEHYRAADGMYGPGALHRRLARCHPALEPEQGWPPPTSPTGPMASAMQILQACRAHPTAAALDEDTFRRLFREQLRARCLEPCWRQALFRESVAAGGLPRQEVVS